MRRPKAPCPGSMPAAGHLPVQGASRSSTTESEEEEGGDADGRANGTLLPRSGSAKKAAAEVASFPVGGSATGTDEEEEEQNGAEVRPWCCKQQASCPCGRDCRLTAGSACFVAPHQQQCLGAALWGLGRSCGPP
jgi:hypothetical protein